MTNKQRPKREVSFDNKEQIMKIFVTGATGFVGSAVTQELLGAGHQVLGLVRSDGSAKALAATGAQVHRGDVENLDSLRSGAAACDAVVHTAFIHDFSKFKENCEIDRRAIEALGSALAGSSRPSNKHLIVTSGTGLFGSGKLTTEDMAQPTGANASPRVASEEAAASVAARGIRVSVLRLPPSVHGDGDHGFVPLLINIARQKGVSAYIGDGSNVWPAVHRVDAGRLYRLVVEKNAPGARYHAVAEEGVPFREIAEAIGRGLNLPVVSITAEQAAGHFGWFAHFAGLSSPASSEKTRQVLNWEPKQRGLIADLKLGTYFMPARSSSSSGSSNPSSSSSSSSISASSSSFGSLLLELAVV
jgi:nucleoside-diphosphate-sugar epimerase